MHDIEVRHEGGDRFDVRIRGHVLLVDQPDGPWGQDLGPTPTELFVAGLAACVAFYAERFLRRHDLPVSGLEVRCGYAMSEGRPARVSRIDLEVVLPGGVPEHLRPVLLRVAEGCTVHNSLRQPPEVAIGLASSEVAA